MRSSILVRPLAFLGLALIPVATGHATELTGTLSVEQCVAIALREHPALRAADADVKAARFRVAQADSPHLPRAGATYSPSRRERTLSALIEGPSNDLTTKENTFTYQAGRFQVSQLLFDFGRTHHEWRAALAGVESARAERESTAQAVILGVKRWYYDLIAARRLLEVAQESCARASQHLDTAKSRYQAEVAPRFDVTRQEVQVANAELAALTARNTLALARENLRNAMGLAEAIAFEPDDRALEYVAIDIDEAAVVNRASKQRPEIRGIEALERAQGQHIEALLRNYLPSVAGYADYSFTGESASDQGWTIGANVRLSIFDGGLTPSQIGQARAKLLSLQAQERKARQQVVLEVRESFLNVQRAREGLEVSAKAMDAAEQSMRIAENRYRNGVGAILELTDSEFALSTVRGNHVRLLADYHVALAQLEYAVGGPCRQ
jgi:outer membrane protein